MSLLPAFPWSPAPTGFVGLAAVARALLQAGHSVRVLARPHGNRRNLAGLDVEIAEGSLEDAASLAAAVAGCRYLFHVAADYRLWVPDKAAMFRANVDGTRALMLAAVAAGIERVVYTSSVATLGLVKGGDLPTRRRRSGLADMVGPYKRSKFAAEAAVRARSPSAVCPQSSSTPTTPIGPGDVKPTPTGRLIVRGGARGRMPGYVDTGLNVVHVDDVAAGQASLAAEHGRIGEARYILRRAKNLSLAAILAEVASRDRPAPAGLRKVPYAMILPIAVGAEAIARLTRREPFVTLDGARMSRKKMFFSSDRAMRELGYVPRPARGAIADAVAWFTANGYVTKGN